MKKIVAIIGSNNKNSFTNILVKSLLNNILKLDSDYTYKIICLSDYNISYCEGCETCFQHGFCPLDEKDDLKKIRAQLYNSDIVIFASPVYIHGISGIMKTLFDRIASYTHLLNYAGKLGFTVTTAVSNGQDIVENYLIDIQESIGIKNLDNYIFLKENNSLENFLEKNTEKFLKSINENFGYSNKKLEAIFKFYSNYYWDFCKNYKCVNIVNNYECSYWCQNWIKECKSFQEFAVKNKKMIKDIKI